MTGIAYADIREANKNNNFGLRKHDFGHINDSRYFLIALGNKIKDWLTNIELCVDVEEHWS